MNLLMDNMAAIEAMNDQDQNRAGSIIMAVEKAAHRRGLAVEGVWKQLLKMRPGFYDFPASFVLGKEMPIRS